MKNERIFSFAMDPKYDPRKDARYSSVFRIANFEYFARATPGMIAFSIAGTVVFVAVGLNLYKESVRVPPKRFQRRSDVKSEWDDEDE